jgi:outer membrane receptor protein involved in Fe transport
MLRLERSFVILLLVLAARPLGAQATYGSLDGTVRDDSGAAIAGATISVSSVERGATTTATSGRDGHYLAEGLIPGVYSVTVECQGFRPVAAPSLRVSVDARTKVDLQLEPGRHQEVVDVHAAGTLLKTDRADVATVFSDREIRDLPNIDRNFTRMLLLTPGTQLQDWQHAPSENPQGSLQIQVGGQPFWGTGYQLDGIDNREPILGIAVINPTMESIAEAKVTAQNFDAELGQATAGVVSVQTRSGSNALHGAVFDFRQDDRFQARDPFTQPPDQPLPKSRRDLFGLSLGGPIERDRWFFFGDYQGLRSSVGGSRLLTVPTERARTGDLSEYGIVIYDPATGPIADRQPFAGNVIPAARLSPQALALLSRLPLPNRPGTQDNYLASGSEDFDSDAFNTRVDGRLGASTNVFARYSLAHYDRSGPPSLGAAGGPELVSQAGTARTTNQSLALGLNLTTGPSTFLDARLGFYRYRVDVRQFDFGQTPAADAGIPGLNLGPDSSGLPAFRIEGPYGFDFGSGSVGGCNCPLQEDEKQLQAVVNMAHTWGRHTVKAGVDVRHADNLRVPSDANRSGDLSFSEQRTSGADGGGMGLATFLLGDVTGFERFVSSTTDARERQWREYLYAQDSWRATSRLTLGLGLRLENVRPQSVNGAGKGGWLDLASGEIRVAGVGGVGQNGDQKGRLHWAPRLSATYQIDDRTVARAGLGRSYDIGVFGTTFGNVVTQNLPVLADQQLNASESGGRVFGLADGPPRAEFPDVGTSGRFLLPDQVRAFALPDQILLPAVDAWNLAVQRQLGSQLLVELAYVGNRGHRAKEGGVDINEPTLKGFPELSTDARRPFFQGPKGGIGAPYGWTQSILYFCGCGTDKYDALQAKLERRFAHGFSLLAHYTLQRVREHGDSQFYAVPDLEYGRPNWDRKSVLVTEGVFDLPRGRGALGGWRVSAIAVIQSGLPFDVTYRDAGSDRDVGPNRPDLVGDPRAGSGDGIHAPFFNVTPIGASGSAFARPAVGTFGTLRRNSISGPGYWRVDGSLFKRLTLGRAITAELRLDVVNLFNHVNLGLPDGEIGVPGNDNPRAGYITSTAYGDTDPQRNLQLGLRVSF